MDNSGNAGSSTEPPKASGATTAEPVSNRSGCGCSSSTKITVRVTPTTGGQFDLQVAKTESVENLKKFISKKLKVPKERICLLHRDSWVLKMEIGWGERQTSQVCLGENKINGDPKLGNAAGQLRDGTLQENQLMDGSRLTLLPSVETVLPRLAAASLLCAFRSFVAMPMVRGELVFMACNPLPSPLPPHPPGVVHSATPALLIFGWDLGRRDLVTFQSIGFKIGRTIPGTLEGFLGSGTFQLEKDHIS
ncbi:unnamed protein product [Timema podura]|uniref:Ubiquitin-like domain-containing protein n=1 Tax=Timema podura TaxID=61482 RepID=A0ABN7P6Z8_TIMPD|nr:unnamed protein product [Timema podura]